MITKQQNRQLHAELTALGLMSQKANLVSGITKGRTEKSSELSSFECNELLRYLRTQRPALKTGGRDEKADRMRKKILSMAWQMNWTYVNTHREVKVDVQRVDNWCQKYGQFHKKLNQHTYEELPRLLTQFEGVYNSYLNGILKPQP